MSVELVLGDVTRVEVDAIVNAANSRLLPGGGVCGAIHSAGGPEIARECALWVKEHGPGPPGGAALTPAGRLPARFVIHAVGPIWSGGNAEEAPTLASTYRRSIELADANGLETIAFPSISTGIFGYPVERAAPVALAAAHEALSKARSLRKVTFVLFDELTFHAYERALKDLQSGGDA